MQEIRCRCCGRLLAKAKYLELEIKCSRCKTINFLKVVEPHLQAPMSATKIEVQHGQQNPAKTAR
ncbi:Com family DNA-binding transcriptional regulator [Marinomonas sp. S3726]|uniref:Com family DNA-binding transcriptional regulator n=1 Tax=Marinomonas sp. S3726 TaxID=579484 RepID=UPI0009FDAD7D|nr:Com family DNA-binding transcriptional regulator [Marinomonas sp. S3726]